MADIPDRDTKDSSVFWKLHKDSANYWEEYIATRPTYDARILGPLLDFHDQEPRGTALDIGSGSGSAANALIDHFVHVVATDNDTTSIAFATKRFSTISSDRLSFKLSSGEDLPAHFPPSSFDLVKCAETFPLMDTEHALKSIHTVLRPSGTLGIWFYGPPFFTNETHKQKCQEILDEIMDHKFRLVVNQGGYTQQKSWKRAMDGMTSWLDYIPFKPKDWENIQRYKWNTHARLSFFSSKICDFQVDDVSRVTEQEVLKEALDLDFWGVEWDIDMVRRFVFASFPTPKDLGGDDIVLEKLFGILEKAMGGQCSRKKMSWPVVLILARKVAH